MVLVPAGAFRMGSADDDRRADPDERPVHEVTLPAYCIGRTEVTVSEYDKCVSEAREGVKCSPASRVVISKGLSPDDVIFWSKYCNAGQKERGEHPVNCVSFEQARTYCKWAGGRLPSEAEWEKAARGTDGRRYPWGDDPPSESRLNGCGAECLKNAAALGRRDKKTMFAGDDGAESTAAVGSYPAGKSPFGALDMGGNVWEWTADVYGPYPGAPKAKGPAPASTLRAVRGGHWLNANPESPRAANRESRPEEKSLEDVGFRCAADAAGAR